MEVNVYASSYCLTRNNIWTVWKPWRSKISAKLLKIHAVSACIHNLAPKCVVYICCRPHPALVATTSVTTSTPPVSRNRACASRGTAGSRNQAARAWYCFMCRCISEMTLSDRIDITDVALWLQCRVTHDNFTSGYWCKTLHRLENQPCVSGNRWKF